MPRTKTLAEHLRDGTIHWYRHRRLFRENFSLTEADIATILELFEEGFAYWQIAARLRLPVHVVVNAIHLRRPMRDVS